MASPLTMANLTAIILLITVAAVAAAPAPATAYVNHTVGQNIGWFFNSTSNTSYTNYSSWAASQTFNLGDYLVFNTENQTVVIETQNVTTYRNCSADDASDESTFLWGDNNVGIKKTILVPLITEGTNYYFSGANDGEQCQRGMAFAIEVNHGLGLPPMLAQPPPPPYNEPPAQPGTGAGTSGGFRTGAGLTGGLFALLILAL